MTTMRAARLNLSTGTLSVEDVEKPAPGTGEVLVKVEAAGVCLSDVHLIDGTRQPRFLVGDTVTLGHEVAGTVAALGPGVTGLEAGRPGACCRPASIRDGEVFTRGVDYDGGWAEYASRARTRWSRSRTTSPSNRAAIIPDAVSTPWAAITATAQVRPASRSGCGAWAASARTGCSCCARSARRRSSRSTRSPAPRGSAPWHSARTWRSTRGQEPAQQDLRRDRRRAGWQAAFDFAGVAAVREQASVCWRPAGGWCWSG